MAKRAFTNLTLNDKEKEIIEEAAKIEAKKSTSGKYGVATFLKDTGIAAARKILEKQKKEKNE